MATLEELAEDIGNRWSIFREAKTIVKEKFEDGRAYALDALRTATETITALRDTASEINNLDTSTVLPYIAPPDVGTFTADKPNVPTLDVNFPPAPTGVSDMDSAIHDKLIADIQTKSPAVSETVQDAIFNKGIERERLILNDTIDRIRDEWAKSNFTLPNGMLVTNISQAIIEHGNKRSDIDRDIVIKTFELSDTNMKFAIQQGLNFLLQRIEVYKGEISAEASRIDAIVRKYLGETEVYKGTAQVHSTLASVNIQKFEAELKYELGRASLLMKNADIDIENFRVVNGLRVEAMKAVGSINAQIVAGALASVNASAHISASNAANYSYSPSAASTVKTTDTQGGITTVEKSSS